MNSDELGVLLQDRLKRSRDLDWDLMATFVGVTPTTIQRWLSKVGGMPRGERLNKLWHFMAASGVDSPEMAYLSPFHRFYSELQAYGIVEIDKSKAASATSESDMLELLNLKNPQDVLRIIRGDQTPVNPNLGNPADLNDVDDLQELYGVQLSDARRKLQEAIKASPYMLTKATSSEPLTPTPSHASEEPTIATPVFDEVSRMPQAPVPIVNDVPNSSVLMLELARKLAEVTPLANYALSAECSEADRAFMRKLLGQDNLFALTNALHRLTSARTFKNGEN